MHLRLKCASFHDALEKTTVCQMIMSFDLNGLCCVYKFLEVLYAILFTLFDSLK